MKNMLICGCSTKKPTPISLDKLFRVGIFEDNQEKGTRYRVPYSDKIFREREIYYLDYNILKT